MNEIVNNVIDDPKKINPQLSENIVKVIMKMISKERESRYKTCYQVSEELYGNDGNKNKYVSEDTIYGYREAINLGDQSGNKTVKIGKQTWMAENLNVDHYRNGDPIPVVQDQEKWKNLKTGAWCYYNNDPNNGKKYGKLYNWYAVNDPRGLAPKDWHIPTLEEFKTLKVAVNNNGNALKALGQGSGKGAGTNTSGFSALLAGYRDINGNFTNLGYYTNFWSSTESNTYDAYYLSLYNDGSYIYLYYYGKADGFSVRCVM
jgi:uncharacterized protein (TIGR02145 family)